MDTPPRDRLAAALRLHASALGRKASGGDPDMTVPTCPDWTLRQLVEHIGGALPAMAETIESRAREPLPQVVPDGMNPHLWEAWLGGGADRLVAAVEAADEPVWSPFGDDVPAGFWLRRLLHDTTVHHADAAITVGAEWELDADLAADGVAEGLALVASPFVARVNPKIAQLRGDGETLLWRPAEADLPAWLVTRTPDGPRVTETARAADAQVVVRGGASDLFLLLSRRITADDPRVRVVGDRALLDHWTSLTAFG
ncbi:maleylpyruvate isomerase family mycothiol-dependent enzyme [Actinomadura oligospora]|uniref:maleylpyruvate isomerase family mycothiol-dependent enzyme n=1 Tax=Actinomadura oligospora TaxID=111804 RepID=UPI00047C4F5F|nr:maleylpyruvate isomerase family mycothiol-dependent enzyme [Actinomadura oligospora]